MKKLTEDIIKKDLEAIKRKEDANKTDFGHLLVCAGTFGMAGAAVMCGGAALRSGCGLLTFMAEKEIIHILQTSLPQAMCMDIEKDAEPGKYSAIAIGPGLVNRAGEGKLERLLTGSEDGSKAEYEGEMVIDAQSLNVIAENGWHERLKNKGTGRVLTPHEGEMARLLGVDSKTVKVDRPGAAEKLYEMTGCNIVLKGKETIICGAEGLFVNPTGNPGMATGGSGDVLTGMIAAFACQGMTAFDAACAGVYIHGLAGDLAAGKYGVVSMTALDITEMIPAALNKML